MHLIKIQSKLIIVVNNSILGLHCIFCKLNRKVCHRKWLKCLTLCVKYNYLKKK